MKKLAIIIMSTLLTASVLPVYADTAQEIERSAISADTCLTAAEILQNRINMLKCEIKDGADKCTAEEMKSLEQDLKDAIAQLEKEEGRI